MRNVISLETARGRLTVVWFGGSGLVFILLVAQSLGGLFGNQLEKAWAWALPTMAPTLSLMISVFASYALLPQAEEDAYVVRGGFFKIAISLSMFYLANVLIAIATAPFTVANMMAAGAGTTDVLHVSNFWLGPLQGLTAASLAEIG